MKKTIRIEILYKIVLAFSVLLNLILLIDDPIPAASQESYITSNNDLWEMALHASDNNDFVMEAIYLYAYMYREPLEYMQNLNGRKDIVDDKTYELQSYLYKMLIQFNIVNADLGNSNCGCFPCSRCQLRPSAVTVAGFLSPPPPQKLSIPSDTVYICDSKDYRSFGHYYCRLLNIGRYNSSQIKLSDNSISSLQIGDKVKVTLYVDDNFIGPFAVVSSSIPDMSRGRFFLNNSWHSWDNQVSSLIVEKK